MEETKKTKKIKISNVICVISILAIIVLVYCMYNAKVKYNKEIDDLRSYNTRMKNTIDGLNEKIILLEEEIAQKTTEDDVLSDSTDMPKDIDDKMNDDAVDQIAKELFEKGSLKVRETIYSSYDQYKLIIPSEEKVIDGKAYERREALYSDIEAEYATIFTDKALEMVLKERFTEGDGYLYVLAGGATGWNVSNVKLERVTASEDEIEYKVTYNDVEIDDSVSEEITCTMKIKLVDGEYRISETDYCELM